MHDHPELPQGTLLAGRFRVVRCLGMGGMGAVYEIEHELTKHRRALKLLHAEMAAHPGVVERFLREASAAGHVGNPHIVESFDAGTLDTGEPYLVLEFLKGKTLTDLVQDGRPSVAEIVDLVRQACEGVQAAHDAGIVHRDLKPDNLFVTEERGRPFVKILDFGISKFDPQKTGGLALTQEGAALGTPYYMSPEQILGDANLDARTDVYALGVILYECIAGRRPFEADSLTHLAVLIHEGKPPPLSEFRKDLPAGFAEVVARAMAPDRALRTPTAAQLSAELGRFEGAALDRTVAAPLPARPLDMTVAAQSLGASAGGVSLKAAPSGEAPPRSRAGLAVLGVGALVVAGAVVVLGRSGANPPAPEPHGNLAASARQEPTTQVVASAAPTVAPTLSAPEAPPPPTASAPAASASASGAAPRSRRVKDTGLAHDNPFR